MERFLVTGIALAVILLAVDFGDKDKMSLVDAEVLVNVVANEEVVEELEPSNITKAASWRRRDVAKNPLDDNGKYMGLFDPDCSDSMILTPEKQEVELEVEKSIIKQGETTCHWNVIGAENCIPVVQCKKFHLAQGEDDHDDPCKQEYLEITDGSYGFQKYCGKEGPEDTTSGRRLRDFFITLKLGPNQGTSRQFKCSVVCSPGKVEGKALDENSEPDLNEDCNCGRKPNADRIVGGEDAKRSEFPWMTALVAKGTRKPFCGGALINSRFILTAAHCFKGPYMKIKNFNILLNAHKLNLTDSKVAGGSGGSKALWTPEQLAEKDKKDNSYRYFIDRYFIHPLYNKQTNDFDVGLIKLDRAVNFKEIKEVSPVCLPRVGLHGESVQGAKAIVAGWGLNDSTSTATMSILQKLDVPVLQNEECQEFYQERFTRRMICAGFREGGKDSCKGDSGGPLISEKSKQVWEQVGIVSFGEGCADKNKPGVYINTRQVVQWIRYISNMEEAVWCQGS